MESAEWGRKRASADQNSGKMGLAWGGGHLWEAVDRLLCCCYCQDGYWVLLLGRRGGLGANIKKRRLVAALLLRGRIPPGWGSLVQLGVRPHFGPSCQWRMERGRKLVDVGVCSRSCWGGMGLKFSHQEWLIQVMSLPVDVRHVGQPWRDA